MQDPLCLSLACCIWMPGSAGQPRSPAIRAYRTLFQGLPSAITLFSGVTFTLMLIVLYGPAAIYLYTQAHKRLQQEVQAGNIHDPQTMA